VARTKKSYTGQALARFLPINGAGNVHTSADVNPGNGKLPGAA
jgi:hypothetical protein